MLYGLLFFAGFKEGVGACCGTGRNRGFLTCGGNEKDPNYDLRDNHNDHAYACLDSFHSAERIREHFAKVLWEGPSSCLGPYSLVCSFDKQTIAN